ncbi:hypothetical protein SAMN05216603_10954 [Pseudomonas benzenivorans]|nr:hypothetical protein [Pseudomonas benzenivorans]SDH44584.1 hypothetical protein SAMN05216603_10954 [Pseudomonas benzenivorans]
MDLLRSLGLFFLFLLVPLGALLASYPGPIAEWLSGLFAVEISRGNLGAGFLLLAAICLRVDLGIRRRAQAGKAGSA